MKKSFFHCSGCDMDLLASGWTLKSLKEKLALFEMNKYNCLLLLAHFHQGRPGLVNT